MSTAPTPSPEQQLQDRQTYDCAADGCSEERHPDTSVRGSYCSRECYLASRGRSYLATIRHDHRYCASCFARLKEIADPGDDWRERKQEPLEIAVDNGATFDRAGDGSLKLDATDCDYKRCIDPDAVTGFQYLTEHATIGEIHPDHDPTAPTSTRQGTICAACGNASINEAVDVLRTHDIHTVAANLVLATDAIYAEGQSDHDVNNTAVVRELRRQLQTTGREVDFAVAVGYGIEQANE